MVIGCSDYCQSTYSSQLSICILQQQHLCQQIDATYI